MGPSGALALAMLSGLVIETGAPDSLCPDLGQTRAAVEARLGRVDAPQESPWRARYTIVHSPENGDYIRLELTDPRGASVLLRDLPMAGESCSTMAQAIALVLERYFRDLEAPPPPKKKIEKEIATGGVITKTVSTPWVRPLVFSVDAGWLFEPSGFATGVSVRAKFTPQIYGGLAVSYGFGQASERKVELRALIVAQVRLGYAGEIGAFSWFGGPELAFVTEQATFDGKSGETGSTGSVQEVDSPAYRIRPGVGLHAGAAWWIWPSAGLTLSGAADLMFPTRRFQIQTTVGEESVYTEVLEPSRFQGFAGLGLIFLLQ